MLVLDEPFRKAWLLRRGEKEVNAMTFTYHKALESRNPDKLNVVHSTGEVQEWTMEELLHIVEEELQNHREINCLLWQIGYDQPIFGFQRWHKAEGNLI
jgi:hypothetical protein